MHEPFLGLWNGWCCVVQGLLGPWGCKAQASVSVCDPGESPVLCAHNCCLVTSPELLKLKSLLTDPCTTALHSVHPDNLQLAWKGRGQPQPEEGPWWCPHPLHSAGALLLGAETVGPNPSLHILYARSGHVPKTVPGWSCCLDCTILRVAKRRTWGVAVRRKSLRMSWGGISMWVMWGEHHGDEWEGSIKGGTMDSIMRSIMGRTCRWHLSRPCLSNHTLPLAWRKEHFNSKPVRC